MASLDQMLSLNPRDIFTKLRVLLGVVVAIFSVMNILAGVTFALDRRWQQVNARKLMSGFTFGFETRPFGAWTWSLETAQARDGAAPRDR